MFVIEPHLPLFLYFKKHYKKFENSSEKMMKIIKKLSFESKKTSFNKEFSSFSDCSDIVMTENAKTRKCKTKHSKNYLEIVQSK